MTERDPISLGRPRKSGDPVNTVLADASRQINKLPGILGRRFRGDDSRNTKPSTEFRLTGRMVLAGLVAFFAVVIGVNAIMIHAAVSTFGGVETESSYRAGLAFAREAAIVEAQDARHWNVTAKAVIESNATVVEVTARDASGLPITNLAATASLVHPTDRRADHAVSLVSDGTGHFRGTTVAIAGQWDLVIDLSRDDERLFRSKNRVWLR
jgi:nitrogen fixation protein FixH